MLCQERTNPGAASCRCQGSPGCVKPDRHATDGYPDPPRAEGSPAPARADGHNDNDDQAYVHGRVGMAGHHPGRERLAAGSHQVIEGGRRERRAGGKGRARERRSGPGSLSLSAAGILRIGGLRRVAVVSGSRFRPPDSGPISCWRPSKRRFSCRSPPFSRPVARERNVRAASRVDSGRQRAKTYARRPGPGWVRNAAPLQPGS